MTFFTWKLSVVALAAAMNMAASQPVYTGRFPCPSNSSIIGYTNTTLLNEDIVADMQYIFEGGQPTDYFHYVLCPETEFVIAKHIGEREEVGDHPIIPGLANTFFTCGYEGNSEDNCVITGGNYHFYFPDFVIADEVYVVGLTFTNVDGASVYGDAHPASHVVFLDCHWKFNEGGTTAYVHYTPDDIRGRALAEGPTEPYTLEEMEERMVEDARSLAVMKETGEWPTKRELQLPMVKYSMSCVFVHCSFKNNKDVLATVFNLGGAVELIETEFTENEVQQLSVFSSLGGGHAFIHENTVFKKNTGGLGPVFVDNISFLQLSRDNFGTANSGSQCDGIFLEDDQSLCFDTSQQCTGQCCAFGDETCDLYVEDDVPDEETQVAESEPETETPAEPEPEPETTVTENEPIMTSSTTESSASDAKCGGFCKGFAVFAAVFGVLVITLTIVFVRRRRAKKDVITGPAAGENEAPELDRQIS